MALKSKPLLIKLYCMTNKIRGQNWILSCHDAYTKHITIQIYIYIYIYRYIYVRWFNDMTLAVECAESFNMPDFLWRQHVFFTKPKIAVKNCDLSGQPAILQDSAFFHTLPLNCQRNKKPMVKGAAGQGVQSALCACQNADNTQTKKKKKIIKNTLAYWMHKTKASIQTIFSCDVKLNLENLM